MRILALDTALNYCSVAVYDAATDTMLAHETLFLVRGHAEMLVPLVERIMAGSGYAISEMDRIAVTVGPGSFTGLRVALSAARVMALALEKEIVGVSVLAALAAPVLRENKGDTAYPVAAVIDARHAHVYGQIFSSEGRTLHGPLHSDIKAFAKLLPEDQTTLLTGSGATDLALAAAAENRKTRAYSAPTAGADIAWVAKLGALAVPEYAPADPLYLKHADAQPNKGVLARA